MVFGARLTQLLRLCRETYFARRLIMGGGVVALAAGANGCTIECDYHYECQAADPSRVYECRERKCVAVELDTGPTCAEAADCTGPGNHACVGGVCALQPSCQQLHGSFNYAASCFPDLTYTGEALATTSDCVSTIATNADPSFTLASNIPVNGDGYVDGLTSSANPCTAGAFDAKAGAAWFDNCTTPSGGCEIALISTTRDQSPCVVSSGAGCDVGQTCQPLGALAQVGVCQ